MGYICRYCGALLIGNHFCDCQQKQIMAKLWDENVRRKIKEKKKAEAKVEKK